MCKLDESVHWSSITNAFSLCTVRWDLSCAPLSPHKKNRRKQRLQSDQHQQSLAWKMVHHIISQPNVDWNIPLTLYRVDTGHQQYSLHWDCISSHKFRLKNYEGYKYNIFPASTTATLFKEKMEILCCFMFPFSPDISCENIKNAVKCVQQWGLSVRQEKTNWIENKYLHLLMLL